MTREIIGTALIALVIITAVFIFFRVKQRRRLQESFIPRPQVAETGRLLFAGLYVSTVFTDTPLDRVWAYGLGHRGKCEVMVSDSAISLIRQGEADYAIPLSQIVSITRDSATIDKGVEARGLIQINWRIADHLLTTNLRVTVDQEHAVLSLREALVRK